MFNGLREHQLFKIPHHTSKGSVSKVYSPANNPELRTWIATSYTSSRLPRFNDGEGVHQLLAFVPQLHLTAANHMPDGIPMPPATITRAAMRDALLPAARQNQLPGGVTLTRKRKCSAANLLTHHVIAVGFDKDGNRVDVRYGEGTLVVRE